MNDLINPKGIEPRHIHEAAGSGIRMRLAGIGHLRDVAWAILEPRGKMSFIERRRDGGESSPPRPKNADGDGPA